MPLLGGRFAIGEIFVGLGETSQTELSRETLRRREGRPKSQIDGDIIAFYELFDDGFKF
ncbi:MAG: hypothetical protein R3F37_11180 [Candidatus Competibacteraceae bacterium]